MRLISTLVVAFSTVSFPTFADTPRTVAAVNAPLAYIANTLGGGQIEVIYPVPQDVDPAYWTPTPEEIQLYQQADLILLNGAGYAGWTETALLPRARLVDTTAAVQDLLIPSEIKAVAHKHGPEGEHAHDGAFAFTTWLDPKVAEAQVAASADALSGRWPDLAPQVEQGSVKLLAEIAAMDAGFEAFFEGLSGRQIFGSHPVYQYLDRAYPGDITELHWEPDTDPGEEEWRAFEQALDTDRRPLMLWEGQAMEGTLRRLEALGVESVVLSPMANAQPWNTLFENLADQLSAK